MIDTALILAGGRGTRLKDFGESLDFDVSKIHKSMIPIGGKPLLERNLEWLKRHGVKNVIIGVGYNKESIINYFGNGKKWGLNIRYCQHDPKTGTGEAFRHDIEKANLKAENFYALNSDQLTNFNLKKLAMFHLKPHPCPCPLATLLLVFPTLPYGLVKVNPQGQVMNFVEKPKLSFPTNAGIYVFNIKIKNYLKGDVERETFVKLAKEKKLRALVYKGFWDTINTLKDWKRIEKMFNTKN